MGTEIKITFREQENGSQILMHPQQTLQGNVAIFPDKDLECKHIYIRLLWHTEGRGTQYLDKVEELDVFQGKLSQELPKAFDFSFVLPADPWSYSGHYVSVVWKVQAQIDLSWSKDPQAERPFILRPAIEN